MRRPFSLCRGHGFSLVELAMVLAIVALLVAGIMLFFAEANAKLKAQEASEELLVVLSSIHSLYNGQPDYTGLSSTLVVQSGQLPNKWNKSNTYVWSPYGNFVGIQPTNGNEEAEVDFDGLPDDACTKMASASYDGVYWMFIDGLYSATGTFSPAAVAAACQTGSNNHALKWAFH
jgi:prepilin-type N-terminal cleavage/methylation domain-containing protein